MNLPASFVEYTHRLLGDRDFTCLGEAMDQEPPVSIRLNKLKIKNIDWTNPVPWATNGYYLDKRLTFTFDPLFHAGCYYVQEASSMFVEQVLKRYLADNPVVMLDLCAAPGGKSTHARSVLPQGSLLVANEVIRNRSQVLAENLTKWGDPDVVVTNNNPVDFARLGTFFDVILTDVPCSGEGMFRKDPVAVEEWSPKNVEICWQRQRQILTDIWTCLKPGGILIYSTCTYNTKEDEENVAWMQQEFDAEPLTLDIPAEWNITGNLLERNELPVYRFLPHRTKGEGFFLAALRKPCSAEEIPYESAKPMGKKNKNEGKGNVPSIPKEALADVKNWLDQSTCAGAYKLIVEDSRVSAFPEFYAEELTMLKQVLRIIQAGVTVAELKGKTLIPAHALAMSRLLNKDAFPIEEISYKQAIAYLHKEAISLPETAPRGTVLLTYKQIPLGFVKNIGNHANNLYPQEWRIRSGHLPEEVRTL